MSNWDDVTPTATDDDAAPASKVGRHAYIIVVSGANAGEIFRVGRGGAMIGRTREADIRLLDEGVSRRHAEIRADQGRLFIDDLSSRNGITCNGRKVSQRELADGDRIGLGRSAMLQVTFSAQLDELFRKKSLDSSLQDELTKTFNRRYFTDRLESELRFANRHEVPLALLLLDIDHFSELNQAHGRAAGDRLLEQLADVLQKNVRNEDVFARVGGEEFAVISRAIAHENASLLAERLRQLVEDLEVEHEGARLAVTISVGVAAYPEVAANAGTELVAAADRAVRRAKEQGRNRIAIHGDPS